MATEHQNSTFLENNYEKILESMKEIIRKSMKEFQTSMNEEFNKVMNKFDQLLAANERGLKVISEMKTSGLDRKELKAAEYDENDDLGEKVLDCKKEDDNQRVQPIVISHEELGVMDAHKVFDKSPEREVDRQLINDKVNSLPVCDYSFLNFVENTVTLRTNKIEIVNVCTVMNYFMYHQQNSFLELKHGREKLLVFDPGGKVFYLILILPIAKCQQAQISILGRIVCAKLSDIFLKEGFTTAGFGQTSLGIKAVNGVFTRAWYTLLNYLDPMIISLFDAFYNWKFSYDNLQASGLVNLKIDEMRMIIFDPGGVIYNMMDARRARKTFGCSWVEIESYMHSFLAAVCSWLNEIKHNYHWRWSCPLHYVDTPDFRCNYKYCRDCHNSAGHNDRCVTATIYNYTKKLESGVNDLNSEIKAFKLGLLAKANRGILSVDEVNLLDDHLLDDLLDSAALGWNTVEREEISITHPARFILVDSGNIEEGELRPQFLGRFGMKAQMSRASLSSVQINHELRVKISKVCAELNVDGFSSTDAIIFHIPPAWALVFKLKFESGGAALNLGLLLWYNVNLFRMYVKHSLSCEKGSLSQSLQTISW